MANKIPKKDFSKWPTCPLKLILTLVAILSYIDIDYELDIQSVEDDNNFI